VLVAVVLLAVDPSGEVVLAVPVTVAPEDAVIVFPLWSSVSVVKTPSVAVKLIVA